MTAPDPLYITEVLALIEEATAPVRHDVRNRIASVRNLAFFVRRKLASENNTERDPRVNEFLTKIEGEVQRTDEVIDAWSARVQGVRALDVKPVSVVDSVRLALQACRLEPSVQFTLVVAEGDDPQVDGDFQTLALAVRCLLENAGEAVGAGAVSVRVAREDKECVITVSDSGPGIGDRKRCLERFETTKSGHLGLGLCMARRVAARAGGELLIGDPAQGAEVNFEDPDRGHSQPGRSCGMIHLLLIDDDESNRVTLSALLEDDGFKVDVATSFADATQILQGKVASYDAILLDHSLGDGYGSELIPLIRRVLPQAKVVAMSGSVGAGSMRRAADAELPKGLHFPDFLSKLQALLGSAG